MNRITTLFQEKTANIVSIYFTAGYPNLHDTRTIIKNLAAAGADIIEIGIPFSDPLADGPTIQASSQKALDNGMRLSLLFEQLAGIREEVGIPLLLMGYLNPVYQYGMTKFCEKCAEIGIDGLILPDLPLYEYESMYRDLFKQHNLHNVFLITPQTSEARIKKIMALSEGFIYMVSSASTTGAKQAIKTEQQAYFARIQAMDLDKPRLIGFGISNNETYKAACKYANGVIIGSAFIKALSQGGVGASNISGFVNGIKQTKKM